MRFFATACLLIVALLSSEVGYAIPTDTAAYSRNALLSRPVGIDISSRFFMAASPDTATLVPINSRMNLKEMPTAATLLDAKPVWLFYSFVVDSSLVGLSLALQCTQYGASEIYIDGRLIEQYGSIAAPGISVSFNPQEIPMGFSVHSAGRHLLAIKYANFNASRNLKKFNKAHAGFSARIGLASLMMRTDHDRAVFYTVTCFLVIGIFIALALAHLFMFMYLKVNRSNLYFSLFCVSMAMAFFVPYINKLTHSPEVEFYNMYLEFASKAVFCLALSGFINNLFSQGSKRHTAMVIAAAAIFVVACTFPAISEPAFGLLLLMACGETAFFTIRAIVRKVEGSYILGAGLIIFIVFLVTFSLIKIKFNINDEDIALHPSGRLFMTMIVGVVLVMPVSMAIFLAYQFASLNLSLAKSNRSLRELISYNAHQMREPLTRITGALGIREFYDNPAEYVEEIFPDLDRAARDLDSALKQVLDRVQEEET